MASLMDFIDAMGASARRPRAMAAMPPRADAPRSPAPDPYEFGDLTSETARRAYEDMLAIAGMGGPALSFAADTLKDVKVTREMIEAARRANAPSWMIAAMTPAAGGLLAMQPDQGPQ